ncbi:MAG: MBL fold metallo-hydrolase [Cyclobacteriaceae bacterium]|nr:MBL fold metallo-hydrolase [Cyclobacteriaceae bacterium]
MGRFDRSANPLPGQRKKLNTSINNDFVGPIRMKNWKTSGGTAITRVLDGRSNVFLVTKEYHHILFDSCSKNYRQKLLENLQKLNVPTLDMLVLSHTHFDHAGNAASIREIYDAKVLVHELEAGYLKNGTNPPISGTFFFTRLLISTLGNTFLSRLNYTPCEADFRVRHSGYIPVPGLDITLLHTPGHSLGMISMIIDDEIALVGDTLFGIFPGSVFPPFAEDISRLILSWNILLHTGCSWFFPAHGRPISRELLERCCRQRTKKLMSSLRVMT